MKTYLEIESNGATRFWQIEQEDNQTTVRYGKLGSRGRTLVKEFDSEDAALKAAEKQIASKKKQGYEEADSTAQDEAEAARAAEAAAVAAVENAGKAPKAETVELASFQDENFAVRGDVNALAYSPDGSSLICFCGSGMVIWDVASGNVKHSGTGYGSRIAFLEGSDDFYAFDDALRVYSSEGKQLDSYSWNAEKGSTTRYAGHVTKERAFLAASFREYHWNRAEEEKPETEWGSFLVRWDRTNDNEQLELISLDLDEETYSHVGCFSPNGKYFAFGKSGASPLRLMDTESGESVHSIDVSVNGNSIAFSPDSKTLAIFATGDGLSTYDVASGDKVDEWRRWEYHASPSGMRFSPDGGKVLLQLSGREVCWSLDREENELWAAADSHSGGAWAFSPDGKTLAVSRGRRVAFRDADTGIMGETREAPSEPYDALHIDPESGHLFAFTRHSTAKSHVFDASTLEMKDTFQGINFSYCPGYRPFLVHMGVGLGIMDPDRLTLTPVHPMHSSTIAMGPGVFAATQREVSRGWWRYSEEKWVRTWTLGGRRLRTVHDEKKTCPNGKMCISPDGQHLYATRGKTFMVWDLETEERIHEIKEGSHSTEHMAISPDGKWMASCDKHRNVRIWDLQEFRVVHNQKAPSTVIQMDFSWDSQRLFLGSSGEATTWDVATASPVSSLSLPKGLSASAMALGRDAVLYVAGTDCSLHSFDASTLLSAKPAEEPREFSVADISEDASLEALEEALRDAAWESFDPLRHTVLLRRLLQKIEDKHGIQKLHNDCTHQVLRHSRRLLHQFGHRTPPIDQDTSPCGRWLATGSWVGDNYEEGGEVQIWERETGRCVNSFSGVDGGVGWPDYSCMEWSPDGTQLGMAYCTNVVGNFLPFSSANYPMTHISVTDGGNRPPGMGWTPDGRGMYVYAWRTCIAPLDRNSVSEYQVRWFEEDDAPPQLLAEYSGRIDNSPDYGDTADFTPAQFSPSAYLQFPSGMTLPHLSQSPLVVTGRDLGNRYPVNPAFPLRKGRKWYWAVAFDTGLVLCPEGAQDLLEQELSFSIENRFAWPVRWADERDYYVTHNITEAVEHPLMSLNAQDRKSLARPKPVVSVEYFSTHHISEFDYTSDYDVTIEEYQLNTQEVHAYGTEVFFEGDQLNAENLAPLVGKCVLYAESYSPERIKVGALMNVTESGATLYYKDVSGGSSGVGRQDFSSIVFVGEAIPAEAEMPTVEIPEDFNAEEGLRAQFPCGKNLSQLSNPEDNATGELIIPLPFEGDDQLTVQWEKIPDFDVDRDFAWEWGHRLNDERTGVHCLGKFFYNGEELEPVGEDHEAEFFSKRRIDGHGQSSDEVTEEFDGTYGYNASLLMRMVPKKKGQFNAVAPVEEILAVRFGWKGSYQLNWIAQGGSQWILRVMDEKIFGDENVTAVTEEYYYIDFFEGTIRWEHRFAPTDHFNT